MIQAVDWMISHKTASLPVFSISTELRTTAAWWGVGNGIPQLLGACSANYVAVPAFLWPRCHGTKPPKIKAMKAGTTGDLCWRWVGCANGQSDTACAQNIAQPLIDSSTTPSCRHYFLNTLAELCEAARKNITSRPAEKRGTHSSQIGKTFHWDQGAENASIVTHKIFSSKTRAVCFGGVNSRSCIGMYPRAASASTEA